MRFAPIAQRNLGVIYFKGQGVQKDLDKAKYWLTKAANQNNADAKEWIKKIH